MDTFSTDNLDAPVVPDVQSPNGEHVEMEFLEGSLDVGLEQVDLGEVEGANAHTGTAQAGHQSVTPTLEEVLDMEFDSHEAAVRFYEAKLG
ncbi:hypothetical protein PIB30_021805 [Stylosanthes scabra]|uniref:Uncharacterized protein n=1 Tax=Stylosanthes scabra TaxID=79078 RepID=A0ABU6W8V1_9FABA|nr:hypothetical protein [Stylosanthes scabra]